MLNKVTIDGMVYEKELKGKYIYLKACTEDDAEFALAIRNNEAFAGKIPTLNISVDQQRDWIKKQRQKEGDYFFIVWDSNDNRIGTISIYDVKGDTAESGRLAILGNALQTMEAQMLSFEFAFEELRIKHLLGYIYADNTSAIRFNTLFNGIHGKVEVDSNGREIVPIENTPEGFFAAKESIKKFIYRNKKEY